MIGSRITIRRGNKDEGERPFWISFADLMTALMVVFLLVMSVALLSVTKRISEQQRRELERRNDIQELLTELKMAASAFPGVTVHADDYQNPYIDFGSQATFDLNKSQLTPNKADFLRSYIPDILAVAGTPKGRKWFKQVVIEGYTDTTGLYLHNLDLSLRRSERLVCVLLENSRLDKNTLSVGEKAQVRRLFLVGGYSSNSAKSDPALSRRIELKLRFRELNDPDSSIPQGNALTELDPGLCALGESE